MATISKAEVIAVKEYNEEVREFTLKLEKPTYFDAGSFLQLTLEKEIGNRWPESRNFSIASGYSKDGIIKLIIRKVGCYTTRIFNELVVGATCTVKLSFGDFLLPFKKKDSSIICIAGGTGIAPVLSFAEELLASNEINRLKVIYSIKNSKEFFGQNVIEKLNSENVFIHTTREKIGNCEYGRPTVSSVSKLNPNFVTDSFYICGGEEFTSYFKNELIAAGAENVFTDEW